MPPRRNRQDADVEEVAKQFTAGELKIMYMCIDRYRDKFPHQPLNWKIICTWTEFDNRTAWQLRQKYHNLTKRNRKHHISTYRELMVARFPNEAVEEESEDEDEARDGQEGNEGEQPEVLREERPSGRRIPGDLSATLGKEEVKGKIRQALEKFTPLVTSEMTLASRQMHHYLDPEHVISLAEFAIEVGKFIKRLPVAEQERLRLVPGFISQANMDMSAIKARFGDRVNWSTVRNAQIGLQDDDMPQRSGSPEEGGQREPVPGPSRQMEPLGRPGGQIGTPRRRSDEPDVVMIDAGTRRENLLENANMDDSDVEIIDESEDHKVIRSRPTEDFVRERKMPAVDKSSLLPHGYAALGRYRPFTYNEWNDYLCYKNQWKLSVLKGKDWKRYAKANRLSTVKTGKQMQLDFFSTAVPNWLACKEKEVKVPALALEPGRFSLIVIYHSIELASLSELSTVIQDLVEAGMLQDLAEESEHEPWEKLFLDKLENIDNGADFFYTTPDDYKMTKKSLLGSLDE